MIAEKIWEIYLPEWASPSSSSLSELRISSVLHTGA
jgi:hypothetical protein